MDSQFDYLGKTITEHPPLTPEDERIMCKKLESVKFPIIMFLWSLGCSRFPDEEYIGVIKKLGITHTLFSSITENENLKYPEVGQFEKIYDQLKQVLNTPTMFCGSTLVESEQKRGELPPNILASITAQTLLELLPDLKVLARKYENLKQKFVYHNLKLVLTNACTKSTKTGMSQEDVFQEGVIGLMRGVDRYCLLRGYRFSTYAMWWIRQAINRAIVDKDRHIRIPVHMWERLNRIKRAKEAFQSDKLTEPTLQELALLVNEPLKSIKETLECESEVFSLHARVSLDSETSVIEMIEDTESVSPDEGANFSLVREHMDGLLDGLSDRERQVLEFRYGLKDGKTMTLEQVGNLMLITRERVRQIQNRAIKQLRKPKRLLALSGDPALVAQNILRERRKKCEKTDT